MTMHAMAATNDSARPSRPRRLLRLPQVLDRVGLKKTALYERIRDGEFPRPAKQGRANVWPEDEVEAYVERVIQSRDREGRA